MKEAPPVPQIVQPLAPHVIKLYGSYLDSESRAIAVALAMSATPHDFKLVESLKGEQLTKSFRALSPAGTVPCLVDKKMKVFGDMQVIGSYLGQTKPVFRKRVYPEEYAQRIQTSLNWYSGVLRPLS